MCSVKRGGHALRGPAEPHLRFPGHRGCGEQRQVSTAVFHPGHPAEQSGLVHGQPAGTISYLYICACLSALHAG